MLKLQCILHFFYLSIHSYPHHSIEIFSDFKVQSFKPINRHQEELWVRRIFSIVVDVELKSVNIYEKLNFGAVVKILFGKKFLKGDNCITFSRIVLFKSRSIIFYRSLFMIYSLTETCFKRKPLERTGGGQYIVREMLFLPCKPLTFTFIFWTSR